MDGPDLAVGRPFVEQVVGVHLDLLGGKILWDEVVAPRLPSVVNGVMLNVLGNVLTGCRPFKQTGFDQPLRHFVNANGTRSATDSLEVVVWQFPDGEGGIEHQTTDAVTASDVVNAAFHLPARKLCSDALGDGLGVVVIAVLNHDNTDALCIVFGTRPDAMTVVLAHDDDERGTVETAKVGEGTRRVAGAGTDKALAAVVVHALDGRNRFHVLETPRGAEAAPLRPVAVVGHPEVGETHRFAQCFSTVGHGAGDVVVGLRNGHPREVLPDALGVLLERKGFAVDGSKEGVVRVVERVGVLDEIARLQALELILHCYTVQVGYTPPSWSRCITLGQ